MSMRDFLDRRLRRRGVRILNEVNLGLAAGEVYLSRLFDRYDFDFVFDVGANTGQYALHLLSDLNYSHGILSIEPAPTLIPALTAALGGFRQWSHLACALDRESGSAEFNIMNGSQFSSLLKPAEEFAHSFQGKTRIASTVTVPVRTFDEVFGETEQAAGCCTPFLKLDTQGTELRILQGAGEALRRIAGVQIEIAFTSLYEGAPDFRAIFEFMRDAGFELSGMFPNNQGHFPRLMEMDAVFVRRDLLPEVVSIQ